MIPFVLETASTSTAPAAEVVVAEEAEAVAVIKVVGTEVAVADASVVASTTLSALILTLRKLLPPLWPPNPPRPPSVAVEEAVVLTPAGAKEVVMGAAVIVDEVDWPKIAGMEVETPAAAV